MIKFIVCDGQEEFRNKISFHIDKLLINSNVEYEVVEF